MNEIQSKEKRLTKKQAGILLIIAVVITAGTRLLNENNILVQVVGTMAELTGLFSLISLFTKRGLRWK